MLRPCMPVTAPSGKRTPDGAYRRRTPQIQAAGCRARPLQLSPSGLSRGPILPRHRASPERSGVRLGHGLPGREPGNDSRSEEHTSELQSLMRISYAVFCLKKKKTTNTYSKTNDLINNFIVQNMV